MMTKPIMIIRANPRNSRLDLLLELRDLIESSRPETRKDEVTFTQTLDHIKRRHI